MGIDLPLELAAIAHEAGLSWPRLDEDSLRKQAIAWRSTYQRLEKLSREASSIANLAIKELPETVGREFSQSWQAFTSPDFGKLTVAAEGAKQAADRLERAATLVGEGKVEMIRDLIRMAKIRDIAAVVSAASPAIGAQFDIADNWAVDKWAVEWNSAFQEAAHRLQQTGEKLAESLQKVHDS